MMSVVLISHTRKFIFIHVYKTGGVSITEALGPFSDEEESESHVSHIKAAAFVEKMGMERFKDYFSFAFVRNPWDWQVSLYHYMCESTIHPQHELALSFHDFREYLYWRCNHEVRLQRDFLCNSRGQVLVDFVGRYENLANDFAQIQRTLGVNVELPRLNVSYHPHFRDLYDDDTTQMVRETFREDISMFDYEF